ncbi:DUF5667 domain-containing protein [Actinomadura keratinilytica]
MAAASSDALPGDSLYGLKRGMEDIKLGMAGDAADRGGIYLDHASTRLSEARRLMERGRSGSLDHESLAEIRRALGAVHHDAGQGHRLLSAAYQEGGSLRPIQQLSSFSRSHRATWTSLRDQLPPTLFDVSDQVSEVFDAIEEEVEPLRSLLPGAPSQDDRPGGSPPPARPRPPGPARWPPASRTRPARRSARAAARAAPARRAARCRPPVTSRTTASSAARPAACSTRPGPARTPRPPPRSSASPAPPRTSPSRPSSRASSPASASTRATGTDQPGTRTNRRASPCAVGPSGVCVGPARCPYPPRMTDATITSASPQPATSPATLTVREITEDDLDGWGRAYSKGNFAPYRAASLERRRRVFEPGRWVRRVRG